MRTIDFRAADATARRRLLHDQWLVTNGLGGFASGTLSGAVTWRYHGLLVSALPAPLGRTVMLNHLADAMEFPDGRLLRLGDLGAVAEEEDLARNPLVEFQLDHHVPVWRYEAGEVVVEKRLLMANLQNAVHVSYTLRAGPADLRLRLRPAVHFRPFEAAVSTPLATGYELRLQGSRYEIDSHEQYPPLRLLLRAADVRFAYDGGATFDVHYGHDAARGYESRGSLWSPGFFSVALPLNTPVTLVASTDEWRTIEALDPETAHATELERRQRLLRIAHPAAREAFGGALVLAADQFVIFPIGRIKDAARARAMGDELRSVIAGYHWFTDWGRDTMISLEGLTLATGRTQEAAWILRSFANYVRDGLIPNLFPEGQNEGLYHTADATLWFFHALDRYVAVTQDRETLRALLPVLRDIVDHHLRGTRFGIHVDPRDGLLAQGEAGYQLTWMDAKVGDWVVTPRRGKAVEINALWFNALQLLAGWLREEGYGEPAAVLGEHATRAATSFNQRFWNAANHCLFDVVDGEQGDDPAIRPNQLFAISLPHPILAQEHWAAVVDVAERELLTPVGLRSLSPRHKDYKPSYTGDLRARDAAYHQGTVWAWLIGPFIDAWLKVHPQKRADARRLLDGFSAHLDHGCVGSISEVFDAEPPFTDRGCIAQAWSVAEVLRCLVLTSQE
ncbi:amylo-alpha-1,6-glucosidase [Opitutus terrae]|uniref:Glycogen debranching enzyme n=1 Tax=Opitutus terrae (strain DSM 11246 / JCM 15787 / PB90-1) TaxID=452637 RepID=B1ZXE7_OPITP|nr:amylo-alpha-1,6-glucosidase [Opitutus terrae]ACB76942.1 glycogen debranching enzyme [Opitutus terrae PB90-1]